MGIKGILATFAGLGAVGSGVAGSYYLLNQKNNTDYKGIKEQNLNNSTEAPTPESLTQPPQEKTTSPNNMKEYLAGKKLTPLDKGNSEDKQKLEKLVEKYSTISENNQKITIENFKAGPDHKEKNIYALIAACEKKFQITANAEFEKNEEIVKNWCTKQTTLLT